VSGPALPLAHETWFDTGVHATDWAFAAERLTLAFLAAAVLAALLVRVLAARWPGIDVPALGRLAPYMPFALRLHLAVSLVGLLSLGVFLSPAMDLHATPAGIVLGAVMALVAVSMAAGWHVREGAALLLAAGPLGMLEFGPWAVLQRADILGVALFVLCTGAGRWSADAEQGRTGDLDLRAAASGVWALRVCAGVALIAVAFAEKLATPDLAVAFLADHPELNVAAAVGLPLGDLEFARLAGGIEVLFGLLLISGALGQAVVIVAGIPFNATLWFFGVNELVGHLPFYGALLVLLVFASDPALRPAVGAPVPPALRRTTPRRRRAPQAAPVLASSSNTMT
jgi:hypothetical protein